MGSPDLKVWAEKNQENTHAVVLWADFGHVNITGSPILCNTQVCKGNAAIYWIFIISLPKVLVDSNDKSIKMGFGEKVFLSQQK